MTLSTKLEFLLYFLPISGCETHIKSELRDRQRQAAYNLKLSKVAQTFACLCLCRFFCVASKLCDICYEAAPIADNFANLYNDQAQPWELRNFTLKRRKKEENVIRRTTQRPAGEAVACHVTLMTLIMHINI